jgi:hypothetical protein
MLMGCLLFRAGRYLYQWSWVPGLQSTMAGLTMTDPA